MKSLVSMAVLLLLAGCAGSMVGYEGSGDDYGASASAAMATEKDSGAEGLVVDVSLPDPPPIFPDTRTIDLDYVFDIANRGTGPVTIKRISIASVAGSYNLERWSQTYKNKTIAVGATDKLGFHARATNVNYSLGLRAPQTVRAEIEFETANGTQKGVFVRNVGSNVAIGGSKTP